MVLNLLKIWVEGPTSYLFNLILQNPEQSLPDTQKILEALHRDYEGDNPTLRPFEVPRLGKYPYEGVLKLEIFSKGFPLKQCGCQIIDAFVCNGSRFNMQEIPVIVEVFQRSYMLREVWAHVYYMSEPEIPVAIIRTNIWQMPIDPETLQEYLSHTILA